MNSYDYPTISKQMNDFTIIELLVVIGIIAILSSILLPALNKAKAKAQEIVCANNLKQCGMGISFYANDYDGYMVTVDSGGTPKLNGRNWSSQLICNGILSGQSQKTIYGPPTGFYQFSSDTVFACPVLQNDTYTASATTYSGGEITTATTYGLRDINSAYYYPGEKLSTNVISLALFHTLRSDAPILGDSIREVGAGHTQSLLLGLSGSAYCKSAGSFYLAHANRGNMCFPDGCVKAKSYSDALQMKRPSGAGTEAQSIIAYPNIN